MKFEKKYKDTIKVSCNALDCKWMVYAFWMNTDYRTFKLKTLYEEHTCAMTFRNKVVSTTLQNYLNQYRANPYWNCNGFAQQLRDDNSIVASLCSFIGQENLQER